MKISLIKLYSALSWSLISSRIAAVIHGSDLCFKGISLTGARVSKTDIKFLLKDDHAVLTQDLQSQFSNLQTNSLFLIMFQIPNFNSFVFIKVTFKYFSRTENHKVINNT